MKEKYRVYPHPVLTRFSDDLVSCGFKINVGCDPEPDKYLFNCEAELTCRDLEQLIESKKASFVLHVECASTRFRTAILSTNKTFKESVPAGCLDGKVEILPMITALEDIVSYKNDNFHEDYNGASYKIKKGDVFAIGESSEFDAVKQKDALMNIRSIFSVVPDDDKEALPLNVDLTSERIVISLSRKNYNLYIQLKENQALNSVLASMIIMPTLIFTLDKIKDTASEATDELNDYDGLRWYRVIKNKLQSLNYDITNPDIWSGEGALVIAQKIIGDPISTGIRNLQEIYADDEEDL
tara:strand:+ start:2940 stop:3830 length:891 start_codon:yes stop_codon:yes gene_type:complete